MAVIACPNATRTIRISRALPDQGLIDRGVSIVRGVVLPKDICIASLTLHDESLVTIRRVRCKQSCVVNEVLSYTKNRIRRMSIFD